jgi:photosystem II stability/assembly factor-like uncharacterized protein
MLGVDPSNPAIVYAGGCITPVFRSDDRANTWSIASAGFPTDGPVRSFAISPSQAETLYAGTFGHGVYRSLDSGGHWILATAGIGNVSITSIAVDPRSSSVVYAGTPAGLYKTVNAGGTWLPIAPTLVGAAVNAIVIDPVTPDTLYLATSAGAFKSIDAGVTWLPINVGLPFSPAISPVPAARATPVHGRP